jgi:hypothetical protein
MCINIKDNLFSLFWLSTWFKLYLEIEMIVL